MLVVQRLQLRDEIWLRVGAETGRGNHCSLTSRKQQDAVRETVEGVVHLRCLGIDTPTMLLARLALRSFLEVISASSCEL